MTMPVPLLAIAVGVGWRRAADLGLPGRIAGGLAVAAVLGVGALAFSSDLARASITTRAMHLPAARTEVRLSPRIDRADELLLAIEQRGSSDGDGPPARWEGHPHAGRFLMFELGRVFAQHVSGGLGLPEIDRVLAWAADLNEQETRSFAAGVAEGLASFSGSVEETFDFGAVLAPLAPVKGRAEPKLRVALDREALRPPLASLPDASTRRALLQGATPADQPLRAWAFGLTSARGLLADGRSPAEVAGLVLDEARELGVAHRERVVEGLAEALGGAAGHDSEACASAREQVPPQWLEVFDEGLVRGAQWAFLWPSGVR